MIVFIAPFPALSNEKDGLVQRVASIDSLVSDHERIYLDLSFRRFWSARRHNIGATKIFQLNCLLHFFLILSLIRKAKIVYIHSMYNALKALPAYGIARTVTDLHGVMPEELKYGGKRGQSLLYGMVERIALKRSFAVIHVTSAMQRHFLRKYGRRSLDDRIVAILPKLSDKRGLRENVLGMARDPMAVIYAGGLQAWQNVPMMVSAAAAAPDFHYIFLSGETHMLQGLLSSANIQDFTCSSVEPNNVPDHYLACTYGFILRDPVLLNQVACPTKLVEYLYWGVIPIVLTPEIGDFKELGFKYITLECFRAGKLPNDRETGHMRTVNRHIVEKLAVSCEDELTQLRKILHHE